MFDQVKDVIIGAGDIVHSYFQEDKHVTVKSDGSPITIADKASDVYIKNHLSSIKDVPIISEESIGESTTTPIADCHWLIDPLDGTKEFINNIPEFCINIALISQGRPVFGVIYNPISRALYFAEKGKGSWKWENNRYNKIIPTIPVSDKYSAITSRYHTEEGFSLFTQENNIKTVHTIGAALKFCAIAEGTSNIYPRFAFLNQWDIAAGQIIVEESGGSIVSFIDNKPLSYSPILKRLDPFLCWSKGVASDTLIVKEDNI